MISIESPFSPKDCTICTRKEWHIPFEVSFSNNPSSIYGDVDKWHKIFEEKYGARLRSATKYPYDCVGMIFASRRAVIDIKYIQRILDDDGYQEIGRDKVEKGDLVLYQFESKPSHIAIVWEKRRLSGGSKLEDFLVLSKWGAAYEYFHNADAVPSFLGLPWKYYTDRIST